MVFLEEGAEGFDDEVVVFALGEAGDGDGSEDARAGDVDGEAASVGGVVGFGESVFLGDGEAGGFEGEADGVGAAVEAGDDVGFAVDPAGVFGRGAGKGGVEERLVGLAEAADVDDEGVVAGEGELAEGEAETPGDVVVEGGEEKLGFLAGDEGEVFGRVGGVGHVGFLHLELSPGGKCGALYSRHGFEALFASSLACHVLAREDFCDRESGEFSWFFGPDGGRRRVWIVAGNCFGWSGDGAGSEDDDRRPFAFMEWRG